MTKILNYGSTNIDQAFTVPHICKPGETLSSTHFVERPGGKGANQSAAMAKAGANVYHAGKVGHDAVWIKEALHERGVDVTYTKVAKDESNGRALIQVSQETGENCIVLYPGTNGTYTVEDALPVIEAFEPGDWIVQQNEISQGGDIMRAAAERGLNILFNPAPMTPGIIDAFPLDKVTILVVNEHEAEALNNELGGEPSAKALDLAAELLRRFERMQGVVVTLGSEGVVAKFRQADNRVRDFIIPGRAVEVKDTTGAGDTFVGYFLAAFVRSETDEYFVRVQRALEEANLAAAIAVERPGSMIAIPSLDEVRQKMTE